MAPARRPHPVGEFREQALRELDAKRVCQCSSRIGSETDPGGLLADGAVPRPGHPIGNHRHQLAVGAKAFAQRGSLVPDCRFGFDDPALPDAAEELVLADHRPRRLNQHHTSKARPPGQSAGLTNIPKRPHSTIASGVTEVNYGR